MRDCLYAEVVECDEIMIEGWLIHWSEFCLMHHVHYYRAVRVIVDMQYIEHRCIIFML